MIKKLQSFRWDENWIIAWVIGFFILWELERMINFPGSKTVFWWIQIAELIVMGMVLSRMKYRQQPWMIIMLLGLCIIFITSAIRPPEVLEKTKNALMRGVFVYVLCPSVGILLSRQQTEKYLRTLIALWVCFYALLSLVGIYCMFHGIQIIDFSMQYEINNNNGVLKLMAYHTVSAANLMIAIMMAVIGTALSHNKAVRVLYILCILIMLYALALTTGRGGMIGTGIGLGVTMSACWKERARSRSRWKLILCILLIIVVVATGVYGGLRLIQNSFNTYVEALQTGALPGHASAETLSVNEHDIALISPRSFKENGISNRDVAYRLAWKLICEKPYILVTGTSIPLIMEYVNQVGRLNYDHIHSMPIQILLETGIVGFGLFLAFMVFFIRSAWKLYFEPFRAFWERIIFLPALCMFCVELIECITRLDKGLQAAVPMMLFAGFTFSLGSLSNSGSVQNTITSA